jgi:hypothetical protein
MLQLSNSRGKVMKMVKVDQEEETLQTPKEIKTERLVLKKVAPIRIQTQVMKRMSMQSELKDLT